MGGLGVCGNVTRSNCGFSFDTGAQYKSVVLTEHLALEKIAPSIGSVGDAHKNALIEMINGIYKAECVCTTIFDWTVQHQANVEHVTAGWVTWYSNRGLHGRFRIVSLDEHETTFYAALS